LPRTPLVDQYSTERLLLPYHSSFPFSDQIFSAYRGIMMAGRGESAAIKLYVHSESSSTRVHSESSMIAFYTVYQYSTERLPLPYHSSFLFSDQIFSAYRGIMVAGRGESAAIKLYVHSESSTRVHSESTMIAFYTVYPPFNVFFFFFCIDKQEDISN
jgi:hypothetical protein